MENPPTVVTTAPPSTFDAFPVHSDPSTVSQRWPTYIKRLENMFVGFNISDDKQKRSLLLYYAGQEVSDIFETLPQQGTTYAQAENCLKTHFCPKKNLEYERFRFREAKQQSGESMDTFHMKLRQLAKYCEFHNTDDEIKSQIIHGCLSTRLRRRALRDDQSLKSLLDLARAMELAEVQASRMEHKEPETVQKTYAKSQSTRSRKKSQNHEHNQEQNHTPRSKNQTKSSESKKSCYFCGGSYPHDGNCPAKGKTCNYCHKKDHFENYCHTKQRDMDKNKSAKSTYRVQSEGDSDTLVFDSDTSDEFTFFVGEPKKSSKTPYAAVNIGNNNGIQAVIDTGSSINLMGSNVYEHLTDKPNLNSKELPHVYAYGQSENMRIRGKFTMPVSYKGTVTDTEFYVSENSGEILLSYVTSRDLGIIKMAWHIENEDTERIVREYEDRFQGLGKLDGQTKLHYDENADTEQNPHVRIPFHLRKPVEKEIENLLNNDIIEPVEGEATPWISPVHVVRKPHNPDQIRICVDMRAPNKIIQRERHITPTIDDIVSRVKGSSYFSKLDLNKGYHQVELTKESRKLTVFSTHKGLFRYKRLNFGTSSAAEIFQNRIRQALQGLEGVENISDDILVHGRTQEEHDQRLRAVLQRLREKNITLNRDKCRFNKRSVVFYGHVFSAAGMSPDPRKVEALREAKQPINKDEVRSFLGLAQYCGRFIPNLASITEPLRRLTKNHVSWVWDNEQQQAFDSVRTSISEDCTNAYFCIEKDTELLVDASPVGLGAILAQRDAGELRVIAMSSRSLSSVEQRYSQIEREALAITWGILHFRLYLYGGVFKVVTDHRPLVPLFNNPHSKPPTRIERWMIKLLEYNFEVEYQPGKSNPADYFSRHPIQMTEHKPPREEKMAEEHVNFITAHALPKTVGLDDIVQATRQDTVIQEAMKAMQTGRWHEVIKNSSPENSMELRRLYLVRNELSARDSDLLLRGNRIVIPTIMRKKVVQIAHEGHQGIVRTKSLLRTKVWFSGIDALVQNIVGACTQCQVITVDNSREPIKMSKLPDGPWRELSCDLMDLPNGKYVMVIVDDYSRFPVAEIINSATAQAVITALDGILATFGVPETMRTDNGPCFIAQDFKKFAEYSGFRHRKVTPRWPRANGEAERMVQTIKKSYKIARNDGKSFRQELNQRLRNYRATPHPTTGEAPATLLFGRPMRTRIPEITVATPNHEVEDRDAHQKERMKVNAEAKLKLRSDDLQLGDTVLLRREGIISKELTPYDPDPFIITGKRGSMVTVTRRERKVTRDSSRFKRVIRPMAEEYEPDGDQNKYMYEHHSDPPEERSVYRDPPPDSLQDLPPQPDPPDTPDITVYHPVRPPELSHNPISQSSSEQMTIQNSQETPLNSGISKEPRRNPERVRNPPQYLTDYET